MKNPLRTRRLVPLLAPVLAAALVAWAAPAQEPARTPPAPRDSAAPRELFEVLRVVDGDTLHVRRGGRVEKLRLLSVDTEEKFAPGGTSSPTKPQTVFGEESAHWAREFFAELAGEDGKTRVGLVFPEGRERRDPYGRLLCHVELADGSDFNLLLVRSGRSPYFNKYGNSLVCHAQLVAAQEEARAARRGIWDPATNRPARPEAPAARRPYERLLPWWECRARAIDGFRARHAAEPERFVDAEDAEALALAAESGAEVEVFGAPARLFDERDGSWTVLFRSGDRERALRVRIAAAARPAHAPLDLPGLLEEFRQNHVYVRGRVVRTARGFELRSSAPDQWRRAGPEPRDEE